MTKEQFNRLKKMFPNGQKYDPDFAKLVDEGKVTMTNASIAVQLPIEDQMRFRYQAVNFTQRQFASAVNWWKRLSDDRRNVMRQILDDVDWAFEELDAWTGNKAPEEMDQFEQDVLDARMRVLTYISGLKVTLPNKQVE